MSAVAYRNFSDVTQVQIKFFFKSNALLAIFIVAITPLVLGVKNLDSTASSYVLERFVSLIGIVLFTPLFFPESDKNVSELVESKYTSPTLIYLSRLLISSILLVILVATSIMIMQMSNCEFEILKFFFGTLSSALFLGSLGFVAYSISSNIVIGYMLPIAIYMLNIFQGESLKMFYLFSLSNGSVNEKYWLFGSGIILFVIGILFKHFNKKFR